MVIKLKIFISGGCKNGKSTHAEKLAVIQKKEGVPLYYIATMKPVDLEDKERIRRHVKEREGLGFETIEQAEHISKLLYNANQKGSFLIDSTTALLANEMFKEGKLEEDIAKKIGLELQEVIKKIDNVVIVSDYIFSDAEDFSEETKLYQKNLAYLDRVCAKNCDIVIEICYGSKVIHKGGDYYETLMERL